MRLGDLDALAENLTLLAKYEDAFRANVILGVISTVRNTKTIDAVPVVRCKDCKYCDPENRHCDHPMGTIVPVPRKLNDFCSYGERKDGDG